MLASFSVLFSTFFLTSCSEISTQRPKWLDEIPLVVAGGWDSEPATQRRWGRLAVNYMSEYEKRMSEETVIKLKEMGITDGNLAVAALNPHCGEDGRFGDEENRFIIPAIKEAQAQGYNVVGPVAADSVFYLALKKHYIGVLSLYHDQGHIAAKTYDFYKTVSITTGLPFIRTSVDHGTAMEIAGQGIANETSLIEAFKTATEFYW